MSCKLNLAKWKIYIDQLKKESSAKVKFELFVGIKDVQTIHNLLSEDRFTYPIYIDTQDSLNILNRFPADENFHTFLLDQDNKVLAIGNPVLNPKIKELYLNIIQGKDVTGKQAISETTVSIDNAIRSLGSFNWQQAQQTTFTLKNTGKHPLRITDVITSCGCTTVEFPKEAIESGDNAILHVKYQADSPESVDTTIKVYANVAESPILLRIIGEAKE
jgi:hypothetical protein